MQVASLRILFTSTPQSVQVGTFTTKRTTVPFLYNLEGKVDGLDVIDFPGVDDSDHAIPELAGILLTLAQMVVFVVDYRYSDSDTNSGQEVC